MPPAVILVDDEPGDRGFLEHHLTSDGFDVLGVAHALDALELVERAKPDLVLLGARVEDGAGLEVCERLRQGEPGRSWDRQVPVIVLGDEAADPLDRVRAFDRGCDDYLPRPFHYDELLARIRAILRRTTPPACDVVEAGEIRIDRVTRDVRVGRSRIELAAKEFELLLCLASAPTRVFTKEELLRDVWGYRALGRTRTLDSHASRLRRKIAAATTTPYVLNEWGVGYRLMMPP